MLVSFSFCNAYANSQTNEKANLHQRRSDAFKMPQKYIWTSRMELGLPTYSVFKDEFVRNRHKYQKAQLIEAKVMKDA